MVNIRHFKYLIRFITLEACKEKKIVHVRRSLGSGRSR